MRVFAVRKTSEEKFRETAGGLPARSYKGEAGGPNAVLRPTSKVMNMKINIKTKFTPQGEYELISPGRYHDGSLALVVYADDGSPQFKATVCVDGHVPPEGSVLIKDWSENDGVYDALVGAGVIEPVTVKVKTHFVEAYECRLTPAASALSRE